LLKHIYTADQFNRTTKVHGYRETGKLLFLNTKLLFKQGVSKSKGIIEYPMEIVDIT